MTSDKQANNIFKPHWSPWLHPNAPDPHNTKYKPHNRAVFASPYGPFPPSPPDLNIHELCFPPENPLPPNYQLFINAVTEETVTLHQFYARVCALARVLRHDGANPLCLGKSPTSGKEDGEILGLFSRNHLHYPMVAHACFRAEVVFGGISPSSTPYELWWMLRKMQITSIMCHESLLPVLRGAMKLGDSGNDKASPLGLVLDPRKIIVLCNNPGLDAVSGHRTIESLVREGFGLPEVPRKLLGGDRLAYLFQSSGTSGLPKAMMISHKNGAHSVMQGMVTATQNARFAGVEPLTPQRVLGELWARGSVVTPGYFKDEKATAELFAEPGWLRTGDLVRRDEHDRLIYLDRLREMIKVKGLQVAATEVENTLLEHPEGLVKDASVAGVDVGKGNGELGIRAWLVMTDEGTRRGEKAVARKLEHWVKGRLSRHKWITGGEETVYMVCTFALHLT